MTFIKEHFFKLTTLAAVCLLIGAQSQGWVKAQNSYDKVSDNTEQQQESQISEVSSTLPVIRNESCMQALNFWNQWSETYNENASYDFLFMKDQERLRGSVFQDLNGDGLPDYIIFNHQGTGTMKGCVYLHNGSGWDLVFQCQSEVILNQQGQVVTERYKGDCAVY